MKFIDVALSSWVPSTNSYLYRHGPRHPMDRVWNYEDRYDFFTIIYDAFWSEDGKEIIVIAPPPGNLRAEVFDGKFFEVPSGKQCELSLHQTGPIHIFRTPVSPGTQCLRLAFSLGEQFITPQPNLCEMLKNERLIVTVSKNNALHWIRDWIYFHVRMHGCTGVIFYDNGSDQYSTYDIRAALEPIEGLNYVLLLNTPFPYGVNNGPFGVNDSRFFTRGALEHARYRFARRAASLMHIDIDELVISESRASVFEAVEKSKTGYISFEGVWVERVTDEGIDLPIENLTHNAFRYVAKGGGRMSLRKTAIAPSRVSDRVFMTTHRAYGARPDFEQGDKFRHRHFIGLKTVGSNIKNAERLKAEPFQKADPNIHEIDPALAVQLQECFESDEYKRMIPIEPYAPARHADICRRYAGIQYSRGDLDGAIEWARHAIKLQPNYPSYHQFLAKCLTERGLADEAADANRKAMELLSTSPEYRAAEIKKLRGLGSLDEALREAQSLVADFPEYADAHFEYGEVQNRLGNHDGAERSLRRAVELNATDPWMFWRWGSQLHRCRRHEEAIEVFRRILDLDSAGFADRVRAFRSLRVSLHAAGRNDEALAATRQALDELGDHAKMTTRLRNDFEGAVVDLQGEISSSADDDSADSKPGGLPSGRRAPRRRASREEAPSS